MKTISLSFFACAAFLLSACVGININSNPRDNSDLVIETRILNSSFSAVSANNGFNVFMVHGPMERVEVQAEAKVLPYIETSVHNGTLSLIVNGHIRSNKPINIYVTYMNLHSISASTHSKIEINSPLKNNTTTIDSNTGATIDILQIDSDVIYARCNSHLRIAGQAGLINVTASGGTIEAGNLVVQQLDAELKNRSKLAIHVQRMINAYVSKDSRVDFTGNPRQVNIEREGDGVRGNSQGGEGVR
jgi:hypothetical protein